MYQVRAAKIKCVIKYLCNINVDTNVCYGTLYKLFSMWCHHVKLLIAYMAL